MFKTAIPFFLLSLFIACNSNDNVDGGPCAYDDKILPAKLVRLDTLNALSFDALFIIEDSAGMDRKDTIRYSALNHHHYLSAKDITKDSLAPGKTYQFISKTIRSGHCNPHIEMLVLKPYGENKNSGLY